MNITLNNRTFLRELPDAPPWVDSSFTKNHSFIFPGDEIVLYSGINLPADAGATSMNQIQLKSATLSIIAKKPNIFTGVFGSVFKATRSFVLDSATVNFNNKNAPVINWCGTDGYAPNMNYQTPRNWKLPVNDFHRQINLFTTHTSGTSNWTYWFYLPAQFRWEYWKTLPGADGDFVEPSCGTRTGASLDNRTQSWVNYASNPAWQIASHMELNLLVNGVATTLISELILNRTPQSISTFNSNTDWTDTGIYTCFVGGTPLNNPCPVYTDQNTSVFAYATKVSAWKLKEQGLITGYIWMEIFQGAGLTQKVRVSSAEAATPESCFISLQNPILNDDGSPVLNDSGDPVLHDPQGVALTFNGQDVIMEAQIDFNKLTAAFPNATGYNIYARIYNNSIHTD